MSDRCKQVVANVLKTLASKEIKPTKILLHKFIYFLSTQGVNVGFRFEPYTYGPYSFDLSSTIGSMAFWDEVEEKGTTVTALNLEKYQDADANELQQLTENLEKFLTVVPPKNFTFDNLECVGTVLYCAEVLSKHGKEPTTQAVIEEFKAWKGKKYSEESIKDCYNRLKPYFPTLQ